VQIQLVLTACLLAAPSFAQELKFAELADFRLVNGEVIHDCRLGYRTFGKLNAEKSNAVLFPTWFTGTDSWLASTGAHQRIGRFVQVDSGKPLLNASRLRAGDRPGEGVRAALRVASSTTRRVPTPARESWRLE
jgi:hypothetical protein